MNVTTAASRHLQRALLKGKPATSFRGRNCSTFFQINPRLATSLSGNRKDNEKAPSSRRCSTVAPLARPAILTSVLIVGLLIPLDQADVGSVESSLQPQALV